MLVRIDSDTYQQYQRYAAARKADVNQAITDAVRDWMESVGEVRNGEQSGK